MVQQRTVTVVTHTVGPVNNSILAHLELLMAKFDDGIGFFM
jgi:hypothetical protein